MKIRKMQTAAGGPIHYSRTITPDNLSKAANYVGEYVLKGLGTFGKIMAAPFVQQGPTSATIYKSKKQLAKERAIEQKSEEQLGKTMTWISPLNYGAALATGNGLNARKGEEKVASWSPAWQAVGRLSELYVGPKVVKGVKAPVKTLGIAGKTFYKSKKTGATTKEAIIDAAASTPQGKRTSEVLMRSRYDTHATQNPALDIIQGWTNAPWNRRRAILDYIITGGKYSITGNKPFGYMQSLAPFKNQKQFAHPTKHEITFSTKKLAFNWKNMSNKEKLKTLLIPKNSTNSPSTYNWGKYKGETNVAYTGGFWSRQLPRRNGYGDIVDAYLYGTQINPEYGLNRISVGNLNDFGIHKNYVLENYPNKSKDIPVYETTFNSNDTPVNNQVINNKFYSSGNGDITTGTHRYDAAGHLIESGEQVDLNGNPIQSIKYDLYDNGYLRWRDLGKLPTGIEKFPNRYTYIEKPTIKQAYRSQDIWKYNPNEYNQKWNINNPLLKLGVRFIDKTGTPIIVRTPWRDSPTQIFGFDNTTN